MHLTDHSWQHTRFLHNRLRTYGTCLIIFNRAETAGFLDSALTELCRAYAEQGLFFFIGPGGGKVFCTSEWQNPHECIESLSRFERAIVIDHETLIRDERLADFLLYSLENQQERSSLLFKHQGLDVEMAMVDLKKTNSLDLWRVFSAPSLRQGILLIDPVVIEHGPDSLTNFNFQAAEVSLSTSPQERRHLKTVEKCKQQLLDEMQSGFGRLFVFNTEFYDDIKNSTDADSVRTVFGLASGFKTNFLAQKFSSSCEKIVFFDRNPVALKYKKLLHATWDGTDFVDWYQKQATEFLPSTTKEEVEGISAHWAQELQRWGGAEGFKKHWNWFQGLKKEFYQLDLIAEQNAFKALLEKNSNCALWISNCWYNEFIYLHLGIEGVTQKYLQWVKALCAVAPHARLYQSKIQLTTGEFKTQGSTLEELNEKLKQFGESKN